MTKNIRISLYILIPIVLWMVSGFFVTDKKEPENITKDLFAVGVATSNAVDYQPAIKLIFSQEKFTENLHDLSRR